MGIDKRRRLNKAKGQKANLLFFLGFDRGLGNTIQISSAGLTDAPATLLVLLQNTNLLKRLEDIPVDTSRGIDVVAGTRTPVLGGTVNLS